LSLAERGLALYGKLRDTCELRPLPILGQGVEATPGLHPNAGAPGATARKRISSFPELSIKHRRVLFAAFRRNRRRSCRSFFEELLRIRANPILGLVNVFLLLLNVIAALWPAN
jgi:hypothetical protein